MSKKTSVGMRLEDVNPKKLTLWHTRTFRPILTHDELEPILAALGFAPLPLPLPTPPSSSSAQHTKEGAAGSSGGGGGGGGKEPAAQAMWREYDYIRWSPADGPLGGSNNRRRRRPPPPRPRLPYPRIDGLHLMAYKAFLVALEFYLGPTAVPDLFHVRTMALTRAKDLEFDKTYRTMKDCEIDDEGIIVYREGTLDHLTKMACGECCSHSKESEVGCCNINADYWIRKSDYNRDNPANFIYLVPLKDLFPNQKLLV